MIGSCANNSDIDSVSFVPSSETVDDIDTVPRIEIVDSPFSVDFPNLSNGSPSQ